MLGFVSDKLDRRMTDRDEQSLRFFFHRPDARIILFNNCDPVFSLSGQSPTCLFPVSVLKKFPALSTEIKSQIFIGFYAGEPVFALNISPSLSLSFMDNPDIETVHLRKATVNALAPPEELTLLGYAHSLIRWHEQTRFCSTCGSALHSVRGGIRQDCPNCTAQFFPRIDPVVIMLVYREGQCLLGSNRNFEAGRYSCLAGFLECGETIEAAVRREVWEEAGVNVKQVFYHSNQPWPLPNQLMIGCFAEAEDTNILLQDEELAAARWFSREEAGQLLKGELEGLSGPPEIAIAWHLIHAFVNGEGKE